MEELKQRIVQDGKVLPGDIIKVDSFLNHQIDPQLMAHIADEFAKRLDLSKVTKVLTAEASGIALATICAYRYGVPMVFAKKTKSDNIEGGLYKAEVFSFTYKVTRTFIVAQDRISADDVVFVVDDFLANGEAIRGLIEIVRQAGATLAGIGIAVEKGFQGGGDRLRAEGYPLTSLAIIEKADESGIEFR